MRRLVLALLVVTTGCSQSPGMDVGSVVDRAEVIRICRDGTYIGRDPVSRRLVWSSWKGRGVIAQGVSVTAVCA